jgi:hypothetical protein
LAGVRSNPRLPGFNRPLDRLSYQPIARSQRKGPVSCVTPGPRLRTSDVRGRASRPQGIERERARRMTGGSLRFLATQDVTQPPGEHGRPRCNGCLRPTRRVTELAARSVVFHPYRRRTPGGCSRDFDGFWGAGSESEAPVQFAGSRAFDSARRFSRRRFRARAGASGIIGGGRPDPLPAARIAPMRSRR